MSFLDDIKNEDIELYEFLLTQINTISPSLDNVGNIFQEYTDHSTQHSKQVLSIGELLCSVELNIYEKAIFILSSYFHDIGMNVQQYEIDQYILQIGENPNIDYLCRNIEKTQELANADSRIMKQFIALEYFRNKHNYRSSQYILKMYPKEDRNSWFKSTIYLWESVSRICYAHTITFDDLKTNDDYKVNEYLNNEIIINILYLTLLLRLADVCHFSRDRSLPYIFANKDFISTKSKNIWDFSQCVVVTRPDSETSSIKIQASCDNVFQHRAIIRESDYINKELLNCHKLLAERKSKYYFNWKFVDTSLVKPSQLSTYQYSESRFKLNHNKIIDLLMGEKLYSNKLYAIRECIQNSIDAIKVISSSTTAKPYIYMYYYKNTQPILEIYDTGTGMTLDIINKYFLSIGSETFWKTEEGIKEWNIRNVDLIADHGIGALSYFMIAETIEVFSKYQKKDQFVHVVIDDFKESIIIKKTPKEDFPKFSSIESLISPWDSNHGSCIRFHLKKEYAFDDLIGFLSINILRCPYSLYLNYLNIEYSLKNIWHFRESVDGYAYQRNKRQYLNSDYFKEEKKRTQAELVDDLYTEKYSFYGEHPPKDSAVIDNEIKDNNIAGKLNINYWNESFVGCRITQNGILIANAIDFFDKNRLSDLLLRAYGLDIDLRHEYLFQLDAERTNIIDNSFNINILRRIEELSDDCFFKQIEKIDSSIYFRCGGYFYHGITDILFDNQDSIKCFNKNLFELHKESLFSNYTNQFNCLNKANIYMTGLSRNSPISVDGIKKLHERRFLLQRKKELPTKGLTRLSRGQKYIDLDKFLKLVGHSVDENTIYLSDFDGPFMEPLFRNFEFKIVGENEHFYLFDLEDGQTIIDNPIRIMIDQVFEQNK